ncbi:putative membrane protein [Pseudomonas phage vB_PaeM_USP_3]|nr:putative membrane protein [Pseudomonas phage vB_PaeM_USP_3]
MDSESKILDGEWVNYGKSTILTGFLGSAAPVLLVITETRN